MCLASIKQVPLKVSTKSILYFHSSIIHCVEIVQIRSYSGPYFPAFGMNTEIYFLSLRIESECGKRWTRITQNTDTFYAVMLDHIFPV